MPCRCGRYEDLQEECESLCRGLILLSVVAFYGGAVPAAERIGIATEIASLRRVLGDASERLDSDNLNQDIQFVELLDASREIRGLLNRLTIRLETGKTSHQG